jgi:hypothetical protein
MMQACQVRTPPDNNMSPARSCASTEAGGSGPDDPGAPTYSRRERDRARRLSTPVCRRSRSAGAQLGPRSDAPWPRRRARRSASLTSARQRQPSGRELSGRYHRTRARDLPAKLRGDPLRPARVAHAATARPTRRGLPGLSVASRETGLSDSRARSAAPCRPQRASSAPPRTRLLSSECGTVGAPSSVREPCRSLARWGRRVPVISPRSAFTARVDLREWRRRDRSPVPPRRAGRRDLDSPRARALRRRHAAVRRR